MGIINFMNSNQVMKERIVYYLNVEDVQTVANEYLGRPLSDDEIEMVEDAIAVL